MTRISLAFTSLLVAVLAFASSADATLITPVSVSGTLPETNGTSFNNLINGSGLSAVPTEATIASITHANQGFTAGNLWLDTSQTTSPPALEQMTFVLPAYPTAEGLDTVHIWQYGQNPCCNDRGTGSLQLSVSSDGTIFTPVSTINLNARENPALGTEPVQSITFARQYGVTHVRFDTLTILGGATATTAVGLGEVRFGASLLIPEPTTFALLGIGLVGLVARRRRNGDQFAACVSQSSIRNRGLALLLGAALLMNTRATHRHGAFAMTRFAIVFASLLLALFTVTQVVQAGTVFNAASVTASLPGEFSTNITNVTNGNGLNGIPDDSNYATITHNLGYSPTIQYVNDDGTTLGNVTFTFAGPTPVSEILIWNYTQSTLTNRGFDTFDIEIDKGSGFSLVGTGDINAATYSVLSHTPQSVFIPLTFGVTALRLSNITAHAGATAIGLDEVRFRFNIPVPEPTTALMLSVGLVGLVARRRRSSRRAIGAGLVGIAMFALVSPAQATALTPYLPTSGLEAHFNAQALGLSNGASVASWTDLTGNGHNATQAVLGRRPTYITNAINGNAVLRFVASGSQVLNTNSFVTSDYSIFAVIQMPNTGNQRTISNGPAGNNWLMAHWGGTQNRMFAGGFLTGGEAVDTLTHLWTGTGDASLTSQYKDGTFVASSGAFLAKPGTLSFGGTSSGEFSNADIAEILVYDHVLSTEDRNLVGGYIQAKYGFTIADAAFVTPEPTTALLLGIGLVGLTARRRRSSHRVMGASLVAVAMMALVSPAQAATIYGVTLPTAGLEAHYVARDLNLTNGAAVASWTDETGNGHHATQADVNRQPTFVTSGIDGKSSIQFNAAGTSDLLNTANFVTNPYSIYAVLQINGPISGRSISSDSTNWLLGTWMGDQDRFFSGAWVHQGDDATDGNAHLYAGINNNAGTNSLYSDGSLIASNGAGLSAPGALSFGGWGFGGIGNVGSEFSDVLISEVFVYDRELTELERNQLGGYVQFHYGFVVANAEFVIPEPSSVTLLILGLAGFAARRRTRSAAALLALALVAIAGPAHAATTVHFGTVSQFSGPGDLDLEGNILYAVNFSGDSDIHTVNGVAFSADTPAPAGASFVIPNNVTPWPTTPNYGATADDNALEAIMSDIRWATSTNLDPNLRSVQANFDLPGNGIYKLQILWNGNPTGENRIWDIEVEGIGVVDEVTSHGISGTAGSSTMSTVYTYEFSTFRAGHDQQLNIAMGNLFGNNDGGDRNAIWQAITLEAIFIVPEPSTVSLLCLGLVGLVARGRGTRRAAGTKLLTVCLVLFASASTGHAGTLYENTGHSMTSGSFSVAYVNPANGDVMYLPGSGRAPVALVAGANATRVMSANLDGVGSDELVYVSGNNLSYYNFDTATLSGPHAAGGAIQDITATNVTGGTTDRVLAAVANVGNFFNFPANTFSASGGGFDTVTSGDFYATGTNPGGEFYVRNSVSNIYYGNPVLPAETSLAFAQTVGSLVGILGGNFLHNDITDEPAGYNAGGSVFLHSGVGGGFAAVAGVSSMHLAAADLDGDGGDELYYLTGGQVGVSINGAAGSILSVANNSGFDSIIGADGRLFALRNSQPNTLYSIVSGSTAFQVTTPEPSTALMLGIGLVGLVARRRRGTKVVAKKLVANSLLLAVALLVSSSSAQAATLFTGGDNGEGLDLQGNFVWALNLGTNPTPAGVNPSWNVGDVIFGNDTSNSGFSHNFASQIVNWAVPNLGASSSDNNLERVMTSIRHLGTNGTATMTLNNLKPGSQYKVQLLFTESCCTTRGFDVLVNGNIVDDNVFPAVIQGGASGAPTNGAVSTHTFTASGTTATIQLDGPNGTPSGDNNPTISGITLEDVSGGQGKNVAYGKRVIESSGSYLGNADGTNNSHGFSAQHVTDGSNSDVFGQTYWLGKDNDPTEYFVLDLGSIQPINYLELIPTHNTGSNDRGTLDFEVYGSNDLAAISGLTPTASLILSGTLTDHSGSGLGAGEIPADYFGRIQGFTPGLYQYLRFESLTGIGNDAGLNEFLAFTGSVPEPSTALMLGVGLVGLVSRRRRGTKFVAKKLVANSIILGVAILVSASSANAATVFTGGDNGEGLDMSGTFVHAYNIGNAGIPSGVNPSWNVGDVIFGNDLSNSNFSHNFTSVIDTWTNNNFGGTANDNNLERVMNSIHHAPSTAGVANIQLGNLTPGKQYKVQMLFTESSLGATRNFDVAVNGVQIEDNFKPNAVMTGSGTPTNGAVVTHTFTASSSSATVTLNGQTNAGGDQNPTLSGITLEDLSGGQGKNVAYGKRVVESSGSYNGNVDGTSNAQGYSAQHVTDGSNADVSGQSFWLGKNGDPTEYFVLDLGSSQPINWLELIPTHNAGFDDRGTQDFEVYGSNDLASITGLTPTANLILSGTLSTNSGLVGGEIPADYFGRKEGFSPGLYQYLRFESLTALNGHAGLNEFLAFTGSVPEPSTALLLGVGLVGLVSRRRRGVSLSHQGRQAAKATLAVLILPLLASVSNAAPITTGPVTLYDFAGPGKDYNAAVVGGHSQFNGSYSSLLAFDNTPGTDWATLAGAGGAAFIDIDLTPGTSYTTYLTGFTWDNRDTAPEPITSLNLIVSQDAIFGNGDDQTLGPFSGLTDAPANFTFPEIIAQYVRFDALASTGPNPGANAIQLFGFVHVPEPSTVLLLGVGLVGLASRRRRRR